MLKQCNLILETNRLYAKPLQLNNVQFHYEKHCNLILETNWFRTKPLQFNDVQCHLERTDAKALQFNSENKLILYQTIAI